MPIIKRNEIKKAGMAGYQAAYRNATRPSEAELQERHPEYTKEQIKAYLDRFDKKAATGVAELNQSEVMLKKARVSGYKTAYDNHARPSEAVLKILHPEYSDEQIKAYFDGFDRKVASIAKKEQQTTSHIRKASIAGIQAAYRNHARPSETKLKKRNPDYTDEQIKAYFVAYDKRVAKKKVTAAHSSRPDSDASVQQTNELIMTDADWNSYSSDNLLAQSDYLYFTDKPLLRFSNEIPAYHPINEPVPPVIEETQSYLDYLNFTDEPLLRFSNEIPAYHPINEPVPPVVKEPQAYCEGLIIKIRKAI